MKNNLDLDLNKIEEEALRKEDYVSQMAAKLVLRVRELEHDLADPNYMYGQTRVCRQGIVCRNVEIDSCRKRIKELEELVLKLGGQCQVAPVGWKCSRAPGHSGPCAAVKV